MLSRKLGALSRLNMEILDFKYVELNDWWNAANITSPFTRVYMVTAGTGYLRCHDTVITMTPGNIYVIPAGFRFSYWCENGFCKVYFHLSIPLPNGYDLLESINDCLCFSDEETVNSVTDCIQSESVRDVIKIKANLYSLIFRCMESFTQNAPGAFSDHITETMEYIEANLSVALTTEQVAEAVCVSAERLRKTFRAEMGVPIGKYIHNRIMNKAELEVRRGEFSVKEISEKLGFCDQFYFSRCFSGKYGMSPTKYRKKINANQ